MVVKRTIAHLRTRPHHERHAVAFMVSVAVMMVVFLLWAFFFFRGLRVSTTPTQESVPVTAQ